MGTYKGLQGYRVESLASDPGTISEVIGKVWYNSGSNVWKVGVEGPGSWSAAPTLNEARSSAAYSGAGNTAALIFGGNTDYPFALPGETEQYNGTSWTQVNAQQAARMNTGGQGTATAALCWGGQTFTGGVPGLTPSVNCESWNGTSWAELAGDLPANRNNCAGAGGPAAPTAALCIGGGPEPVGRTCVLWNGTSWADDALMSAGASGTMGWGTSTAALCIGGSPTPRSNDTEEFNGTSWTIVNPANNNRVAGGASGTTTAALQFGGYDSNMPDPTDTATANVEKWNGTAWTEVANIAVRATTTGGCSISSTATMKIGGYSGPPEIYYNYTEEWQDPVIGAKTITTS